MLCYILHLHPFLYSSWEARLAFLYKQAKAPVPPALRLPWYKDLPHSECRQAAATAKLSQSALSPGGAVMSVTLPEQTTPTLLIVSEFSAVLSFTSPDNSSTTLVYWDLETQSVTYHYIDVPSLPVCWSEGEHHALILKGETWPSPFYTYMPDKCSFVMRHCPDCCHCLWFILIPFVCTFPALPKQKCLRLWKV